MHQRFLRIAAPAALALVAALGACTETTTPSSGPLTVMLTDAPFPYDQVDRVDMYVVRIDAKQASTSDEEMDNGIDASNDEPGDEHDGWTTIATPNASYNLLDLQNGTTTNLGQLTIPTGTYRSFRLILDTDKSSITLKDGTVLDGNSTPGIKFPSAGRTGIKVNLLQPISLTANGSVMVLDFDLANSFVLRGNDIMMNGLLFKPVIRGTARDITGALSGSVHGDSATGPAVADATVQVLKAGTPLTDTVTANILATTKTDATGAFLAAWLLPGTYTLRALPPAASVYGPALAAANATVTSGTTPTDVGVIVVPKK